MTRERRPLLPWLQGRAAYVEDVWNDHNNRACFNVFMTVAYDADGKWEIRAPKVSPAIIW